MINLYLRPLWEAFNIRHSGLDPESRISVWISPFVRMTDLVHVDIYATFRVTRRQIAGISFGFFLLHSEGFFSASIGANLRPKIVEVQNEKNSYFRLLRSTLPFLRVR